jgi:hypothetical protein
LPPYTDKQLADNTEVWSEKFVAGKSSPQHVLALLSTKYVVSPEQAEKIRGLAAKPAQPVDDQFVKDMEAAEGAQE